MRRYTVLSFLLTMVGCATAGGGGDDSAARAKYVWYAGTFASDTYPSDLPPPPQPDDVLIVTTPTWEAP